MCHLFMLTCASVSFKWLWYGLTAIQREKVFFSSLYLYIFFLLLIEHIVCGHVCVCKCTCVWVHIHVCTHTFGGQRTSMSIISQTLPIFISIFRHGLQLAWNWQSVQGWLNSESRDPLFSAFSGGHNHAWLLLFYWKQISYIQYILIAWLFKILALGIKLGSSSLQPGTSPAERYLLYPWIFFFYIHSLKVPCNCFSLALEGTNKKKMWYNLVATRDWSLNSIIPVLSLGTLTLSANIHKISS